MERQVIKKITGGGGGGGGLNIFDWYQPHAYY